MAVRDEAITTGTDGQGDLRKRIAGQAPQANGGYAAQDVKEKTKQKVGSCDTVAQERAVRLERDDLGLTLEQHRQAPLSTSSTSTSS
jgi:hypothetical protein